MEIAIFIALLLYAAVMLCIVRLPESETSRVLNRIQNGDTRPSIFDDVSDTVVLDFANGLYESDDIDGPEYRKFCASVRASAQAVLHHREHNKS